MTYKKRILTLSTTLGLIGLLYWGGTATQNFIEMMTFVLLTLLLALFAASLGKNKTPLITRYALLMNAEDTPEERQYTKIITWIWLGFLFILWLLKLNALVFQLTFWALNDVALIFYLGSGMLFVAEFYIRPLFLPHHKGRSLLSFLLQLSTISLKQIWQFDRRR